MISPKAESLLPLVGNRHPFTIILLLVSMTLSGCRTSQNAPDRDTDLKRIAEKTLGKENIIALNESGTFALCRQKPGLDHARRQYRFVVIRLKDNAIVYDGTFSMGYVKWLDDQSIEVVSGSPLLKEGGTKEIIHVNSPVQ